MEYTVTLGELIVSEGLAENFATSIFGEDLLELGIENNYGNA